MKKRQENKLTYLGYEFLKDGSSTFETGMDFLFDKLNQKRLLKLDQKNIEQNLMFNIFDQTGRKLSINFEDIVYL